MHLDTYRRSPMTDSAKKHPMPVTKLSSGQNKGVASIINHPGIQPKLQIGAVNDPQEKEADSVADKVVRMQSEPSVQRKCEECEEQELQLKPQNGRTNNSTPAFSSIANSASRPLPDSTNHFMSKAIGSDFSNVRLHTDAPAKTMNEQIGARAFTFGQDIYFNQNQYHPETTAGKHLLAHELTHVVQQNAGSAPPATLQRQAACAHPGESRNLDLQPVCLRTDATDTSPTGTSWTRRFNKANEIWGKLGVTFTALSAITLDSPLKNTGADFAELNAIRALRNSTGVEVFMVDNDISFLGGAGTWVGCDATVMSDRGTSDTLLAHEAGHILGLGHNGTNSDTGTVMDGSGSMNTANSTRNTMVNYNFITCPAASGPTCLNPDT